MQDTFTRHMAAIDSGTISNGNVIGIRKALNTNWRTARGYSLSATAPDWTNAQCELLLEALDKREPRADAQLEATGRARLTDKRYAKRWSARQADIIADISHFTLCGFTEYGRGRFVPVWRVHARDGFGTFRFINPSWQSGGDGPEVY